MPETHQDNGASMDQSQAIGSTKIKLLIFGGLERLAKLEPIPTQINLEEP
jgi:hypothetical protein